MWVVGYFYVVGQLEKCLGDFVIARSNEQKHIGIIQEFKTYKLCFEPFSRVKNRVIYKDNNLL